MKIPLDKENLILKSYFYLSYGKILFYYKINAVNSTIETIANVQELILLICITGLLYF